jgi:hypothetical protein
MPRWAKLRLRPGKPPVLVKSRPAKCPRGRPRKPEVYTVKRPRGRPPSPGGVTPSLPLGVRVPRGVVTQVDAVAQARGLNRSKALVLLLKAGLSGLGRGLAPTARRGHPV